jgi:DNA-binding beta-propeller fold protein YncE
MKLRLVPFLLLLLTVSTAWACGSSEDPAAGPGGDPDGGSPTTDGGADGIAPNRCPRVLGDPNHSRKVVVSHPFKGAGMKGTTFEVLDLSLAGALTKANVTFEMGTAHSSPIVFTPDGAIGLVAQDDGSVGAFAFEPGGVRVVHAAFRDNFYATSLVIDPNGARAFVLDANTNDNGGGVYELTIGCDGTLTNKGRVITGGRAAAMAFFAGEPGKAVLSAANAGKDIHILDLGTLALTAGGTAFPSGDAIVTSVAVMPDGKYALVADDSVVAGNRVAVVALPAMTRVQTITTEYPAAVVASPFGNMAIVLNDDSTDEITVLRYDAQNTTTPFTNVGRVTYAFPKPEIPTSASMIEYGSLKGRVLVSENLAVRQLQFTEQGGVTDTEKFAMGSGIPNIVGVVGVTP